jgi:hypothetical protein
MLCPHRPGRVRGAARCRGALVFVCCAARRWPRAAAPGSTSRCARARVPAPARSLPDTRPHRPLHAAALRGQPALPRRAARRHRGARHLQGPAPHLPRRRATGARGAGAALLGGRARSAAEHGGGRHRAGGHAGGGGLSARPDNGARPPRWEGPVRPSLRLGAGWPARSPHPGPSPRSLAATAGVLSSRGRDAL